MEKNFAAGRVWSARKTAKRREEILAEIEGTPVNPDEIKLRG
jgi:hypothetical protein